MQFYDNGCENCISQSMMGDAERVQECTTNDFQGLVTILNPGSSWTARWLHIGEIDFSIHLCTSAVPHSPRLICVMRPNLPVPVMLIPETCTDPEALGEAQS